MKRQQIYDRNEYDFEDRQMIAMKSNGVCAHCGKRIEFGGKATVDHFVPLSKGGINQKCNIIMLCYDCNMAKSNKIIHPEHYLRYLKPPYDRELFDYFDSYIRSFEYISRGNLLCCDEYVMRIYPPIRFTGGNRKKQEEMMQKMAKYYTLTRARRDDIPEVTAYYTEYLRHYGILDSEEAAAINIEFWNQFGVIYFVRDSEGQIRLVMPIMMHEDAEGKHNLVMRVFSRYKNALASVLIYEIPAFIASTVSREQKLPFLKVVTSIVGADNAKRYLPRAVIMPNGSACSFICWHHDDDDMNIREFNEEGIEFYRQFKDVRVHLDRFFAQPGYENMTYMGEDLIEGYASGQEPEA